jgi:hypothetical protein
MAAVAGGLPVRCDGGYGTRSPAVMPARRHRLEGRHVVKESREDSPRPAAVIRKQELARQSGGVYQAQQHLPIPACTSPRATEATTVALIASRSTGHIGGPCGIILKFSFEDRRRVCIRR